MQKKKSELISKKKKENLTYQSMNDSKEPELFPLITEHSFNNTVFTHSKNRSNFNHYVIHEAIKSSFNNLLCFKLRKNHLAKEIMKVDALPYLLYFYFGNIKDVANIQESFTILYLDVIPIMQFIIKSIKGKPLKVKPKLVSWNGNNPIIMIEAVGTVQGSIPPRFYGYKVNCVDIIKKYVISKSKKKKIEMDKKNILNK